MSGALAGWAPTTHRRTSNGVGTNRFPLYSLILCAWLHPLSIVESLGFPGLCSEILGGLWTLFFFFFYGVNSPTVNTSPTPSTPGWHWSRVLAWSEGCASGSENGAELGWAVYSFPILELCMAIWQEEVGFVSSGL